MSSRSTYSSIKKLKELQKNQPKHGRKRAQSNLTYESNLVSDNNDYRSYYEDSDVANDKDSDKSSDDDDYNSYDEDSDEVSDKDNDESSEDDDRRIYDEDSDEASDKDNDESSDKDNDESSDKDNDESSEDDDRRIYDEDSDEASDKDNDESSDKDNDESSDKDNDESSEDDDYSIYDEDSDVDNNLTDKSKNYIRETIEKIKNRIPEKIVGANVYDDQLTFIITFQGDNEDDEGEKIQSEVAKKLWPKFVIDFFEKHLIWK